MIIYRLKIILVSVFLFLVSCAEQNDFNDSQVAKNKSSISTNTNDETDNDKRIQMVFDEIDKISKMKVDEVDTLYNRMKSVLDHNYSHLQRYTRKVDSQILEIF